MTFEESFFGPGNGLKWEAIQRGELKPEATARLQPFLDELFRGAEVCALPRIVDRSTVHWYILCKTMRDERAARDEVRAFVGPSYSLFDGQPSQLSPSDPVEAAVIERHGTAAFRVDVPSSGLGPNLARERTRERLGLWLRLRREQPPTMGLRLRPTGRILRDFEYALFVADDNAALACIDELRRFGRLDARNLLFLEVRRLASMGRWREIRELSEFDSLLAIRRPHRVTEAVIAAVYITEIEPFELEQKSREAVEHFHHEIFPRFADLYRSRRGLTGEEVNASFVLAALTEETPRTEAAAAIIDGFVGDPRRRSWLETLTRVLPTASEAGVEREPSTNMLLEEALTAFASGELDHAVELAARLPHSIEQAKLLLRCAREVGTIDLVRRALDAVDRIGVADRAAIEEHVLFARLHAELREFAGGVISETSRSSEAERVPASWIDWLRKITLEKPWPAAVAVADLGAREWTIDPLLLDATAIGELAELIAGNRPAWGEEALRDASPHLIEALLGDGPRPSFQTIYDELLLLLLTEPNPSLPSFRALTRLLEARLTLAINAESYSDFVDGVGDVLDRLASPAACESALDALEVLLNQPSVSRPAVEAFAARVVGLFNRWHRRVDALQRALLAQILRELDLTEMMTNVAYHETTTGERDSLFEALRRTTLALYSLNERALARVANTLNRACKGINVSAFHDRVGGSSSLRSAAVSADVFVIAPSAAKHAATTYILQHRPKKLLTLYARGQGSAGMLAILRESTGQILSAAAPSRV